MTERLESGQIQIRPVNAAPMQQVQAQQVDYGIAARERARYANTMGELLDRMGEKIHDKAKELRTQEAIRYAAENPPTLEQLAMVKNGVLVAVPGLGRVLGDFGYFGQALKKARELQVASAFEQEGLNELANLLAEIEGNSINAGQVRAKISGMSKGLYNALVKINPEAAIKVNATIATHGNTVLRSALEADEKKKKAVNVIKLRQNFDNIKRLLEATISQGFYKDPETGEKYSINVLSDTLRANLQTQTLALGDTALAKEFMDGFEKELRDAKINAVIRHILNEGLLNDPNLRQRIMNARLDNLIPEAEINNEIIDGTASGKMNPIMRELLTNDMDAVADILAKVNIALNHRESESKRKEAEIKSEYESRVTALATEGFGLPESDTKGRTRIGQELAEIRKLYSDLVPLDLIKEMVEPAEKKEGNSQVEFNVRALIFEGKITKASQIWAYTKQGLSTKQAISALNVLYREDKQDSRKLDAGLAAISGVPNSPGGAVTIDPKGDQFEELQRNRERVKEIKARYKLENKPEPTADQILEELRREKQDKRKIEKAQAARNILDMYYSQRNWLGGSPKKPARIKCEDKNYLPLLKAQAEKNNKMTEYYAIERLCNEAEGKD